MDWPNWRDKDITGIPLSLLAGVSTRPGRGGRFHGACEYIRGARALKAALEAGRILQKKMALEISGRKKHWFTNDSKLFRGNGELLCDLHMHSSSNTADLKVAGQPLAVTHRNKSPRWRLVRDNVEVVLLARKFPSSTLAFVVQVARDDGSMTLLRIQMRSRDGDDFDVHELAFTADSAPHSGDEAAATAMATGEQVGDAPQEQEQQEQNVEENTAENTMEEDFATTQESSEVDEVHAELVATFRQRSHSRKYHVEVHREFNDHVLSFLFFFFVMMNRIKRFSRTRSSGDGGKYFYATCFQRRDHLLILSLSRLYSRAHCWCNTGSYPAHRCYLELYTLLK